MPQPSTRAPAGPSRRQMLASAAALAVSFPALAQTPPSAEGLTASIDRSTRRLLSASPQLLTILGLDAGPNAAARSALEDRSPAGIARTREIYVDFRDALARYDPKALTGADWINHQSALFLVNTTLESFGFGYGDPNVGVAAPYIISQLNGAYRTIPAFLATQHPVATVADAEAYLARLSAFAGVLDQETGRARQDFAHGATPPDFVLRTTLQQFAALLSPPAAQSEMVTGLTRRTDARQIPGAWRDRAARIVQAEVYPALKRQADLLDGALGGATAEAGVWRLPQGEAYYRFSVRAATTTDISGQEIHDIGLSLVAELTAKADAILKARGLSRGTVAQRIAGLRKDPAQLFADSDAGRAALIADLRAMVDDIQRKLPDWFAQVPKAALDIRRMPASIEPGASGATYQPPSLDGTRPGLFSINLRNMAEWPRFDLPTLVYHEGIPGHHLQNALANEAKDLPLLRRLPLYSGYSEGWGVYAEQLADEMGAYRNSDLGRLGYIASMMFRAVRLVVDSGLHEKRWSREQAVAYMLDTLGDAETSTRREVERYCVQPAQASSYMLGWRAWIAARSRAQAKLGARFDIRGFHEAGLLNGNMPLVVLSRVLDDWSVAGGKATS